MTEILYNVKASVSHVTSDGKYLLDGHFFDFDYGTDNPDEFVQTVMLQYGIDVQLPVTWNNKGFSKMFQVGESEQIYFVREKVVGYNEREKTHEKRASRNTGWGD